MREASRPWTSLSWLVLLLVAPGSSLAAGNEDPAWTVLIEDHALDATMAAPGAAPSLDPRVDLLQVAVAEAPAWLSIRLTTRASAEPTGAPSPFAAGSVETLVEFTTVRLLDNARATFRIVATGEEAVVTRDGAPHTRLPLAKENTPWSYTLRLQRWDLLPEGSLEIGDLIHEPWATARTMLGTVDATDRAPSLGFGTTYTLTTASNSNAPLPPWAEMQGVDYVAGPSIAIANDGTGHVAYIVYRSTVGITKGLYHATFDAKVAQLGAPAAWKPERVADAAMQTEQHETGKTQTAIAVTPAGVPHIVYHPRPNTGSGVRYATPGPLGWTIEDPSRLADGKRLPVDDTFRAVPAIVATGARTVVAFQSGDDVVLVARVGDDAWHLVKRIEDARFPRLAVTPSGELHIAWLGSPRPANEIMVGTLRYARESGGWSVKNIVSEVLDYSPFWKTSASDGSFAFALDRQARPQFVWETQRGEPTFATLIGGRLETELAPLTPGHGNPQVRMRMLVDTDDRTHILTGYGGSDTYAIRDKTGLWMRESTPSQEMAHLALTPDGRAITAYTQPHGGETLAMRAQTRKAGEPGEANALSMDSTKMAQGPELPYRRVATAAMIGGTLGALAAMMIYTRNSWSWRLFALVGAYTRIARPEAAAHETRAAILSLATDEPGIAASAMRRRLGIPRSTFFYHLRRLEHERYLTVHREAGRVAISPVGWSSGRAAALPLPLRTLAEAVRAAPERTALEYAANLEMPRRTVAHQLKQLEARGLIVRAAGSRHPIRWRLP